MNIQDIHKLVEQQRKLRMVNSPQLTLGELIKEIEQVGVFQDNGEAKNIWFDFGSALPTHLDSWRGSYSELALGYQLSGYDNNTEHFANCKADELLEHLKSAIGKEFTGWKGGDYIMDENTPIWVANSGNSDNTAVVGVLDCEYKLVIITAYCEY